MRLVYLALLLLLILMAGCRGTATPSPTPGGEAAPAPGGGAAAGRLVVYTMTGGIAGFCDRLTIMEDGQAVVERECKDEREVIRLSPEAFRQVKAQAAEFGAYRYEDPGSGGADSMAVTIEVFGEAQENPPDEQAVQTFQALLSRILTGAQLPQ